MGDFPPFELRFVAIIFPVKLWAIQTSSDSRIRYHCYASFPVTCVIFNQRFDLVINDRRPAGTFAVFQIKILTSESSEELTNSSISNGTISINGIILCCFFPSKNNRTLDDENAGNNFINVQNPWLNLACIQWRCCRLIVEW